MLSNDIFTIESTILENKKIAEGLFLLNFENKDIAQKVIPGQFINLKIPNDSSLILRRPFSVHDVTNNVVSIIYLTVGKGTNALSKVQIGTTINVMGPLGNGFTIIEDKPAFIVGGGCGTPPMYFLAKKMREKGMKINSYIGFSTKDKIMLIDEFNTVSTKTSYTTDDGSSGIKGKIVDVLFKEQVDGVVYACGPVKLLAVIQEYCNKNNIPAQLSLEENMGCGFGVCLGCAVKTVNDNFKYVCKDGPVFDAKEVIIGD